MLIDGNHGTIHHLADTLNLPINENQDKDIFFEDYHKMLGYEKTEYYFSKKYVEDEKTLEHLKTLHNRLEYVRKM